MHPNIIFAKFQIHANVIPRRRNEGKKGTSIERMWCGVVSFQCSFILLLMVWSYIQTTVPINTNIEQCMCMRASGASELRKCWHFYILKLLFLSIFCRYIHWQITCIPWLNFIWGGKRPPPPPQAPPPVRQCPDLNCLPVVSTLITAKSKIVAAQIAGLPVAGCMVTFIETSTVETWMSKSNPHTNTQPHSCKPTVIPTHLPQHTHTHTHILTLHSFVGSLPLCSLFLFCVPHKGNFVPHKYDRIKVIY